MTAATNEETGALAQHLMQSCLVSLHLPRAPIVKQKTAEESLYATYSEDHQKIVNMESKPIINKRKIGSSQCNSHCYANIHDANVFIIQMGDQKD